MKYSVALETAHKLLTNELKTDLGSKSFKNDVTSQIVISNKSIKAYFVARTKIVLCGINFIESFIKSLKNGIVIKLFFKDGDIIKANKKIASLQGDAKKILVLERTLLNFLQHLSSISTTTYFIKEKLKNTRIQLLDTRKTITGLRIVQKYATQKGGAKNHRIGLYDKIFIKDNHIKIAGGIENIRNIINRKNIRDYIIECDNYNQARFFIEAGAKYILLDNMKITEIKKILKLKCKNVKFEVSGGINISNIKKFLHLKIHFISVGFITQNPEPTDIGLDII